MEEADHYTAHFNGHKYMHHEFGEHCGAMINHSDPDQSWAVGKGRVGFLEEIMST